MQSSIATYRESLSRLAGEVDDATADEVPVPAPSREGDHAPTPPPSGRRRRHSRPNPAESDEISKLKEDIEKLQASEAEIKALSFNYAAMLKEKEEQLGKLREENGSLRRSMESSIYKAVSGNSNGNLQRSPSRTQRNTVQENSLNVAKQNWYGSGASQGIQQNGLHLLTEHHKGDVFEEESSHFASKQASLETEIKQLKQKFSHYSNKEDETKKRLEEENKRNELLQQQLNELKVNMERISLTTEELHTELGEKKAELNRMQDELSASDNERASDGSLQTLRSMLLALQKENSDLKIVKGRLEADLTNMEITSQKVDDTAFDNNISDAEKVKEEMASLKRALHDTSYERDRALQNLSRLKQHLLDKDLEDQEKMDEDSKVIEELRAICEQQRAHMVQLERALKTEMAKQEESKKIINDQHLRSNEQIEDLKYKLTNCMNALESKDVELLNLQTALGQYYAESEAKDRIEGDLAMAKEELAKLSESLMVANQTIEISRREKDQTIAKLSQAERMLAGGKRSMQKLEDDNSRLRCALEQSMTTVNRMSLDSDNSVDRRIVIKLLVTYFQRNHSKEVLDLMVRMLGFSLEDKQRIGSAQSIAGKGVVRGVLGLPRRLVGGIVGGNSAGKSTYASQDKQESFADLWVDFLLKETEEREKQKASEAATRLSEKENRSASTSNASSFQPSPHPAILAPGASRKSHQSGHPESEFGAM
ncbi:unnamed protein product [Alopecurus aequalis]